MADNQNNGEAPDLVESRAKAQPARDARCASGGDRAAVVTSGAASGTSGWRGLFNAADPRDLWQGLFWIAVIVLAVVIINVQTALSDFSGLAVWEPWVWEASSLVGVLLIAWVAWLTVALAPPEGALANEWRPTLRFAVIHLIGAAVFCAVHVGVFILIRKAAYALIAGGDYTFGDRLLYEFRKDLISYSVLVGIFWLTGYLRRKREEPLRPVSFDIRDGSNLIRAPLSAILAVSSAGNYVEFYLADGRRPMMRATLAAIEVELRRFGFVRAHRSWLVNLEHVTGMKPERSGDWTVELGTVEAPLSRRYPGALERLRRVPELK